MRRAEVIVVAAAWAAALALLVARLVPLWPWTLDDAFITLRYARNWVDAGALAYTPGAPPAEGYTSLVWTLLLAAPHALHLDAERFAKVAGVVATLATLGGTARLAGLLRAAGEARASPVALGAAPVLLASVPAVAAHAVSGMETALCAALATWFLAALVASLGDAASRRPWLLLALGTALGLTRPEGFAFAGLGLGVWLATAPQPERGRRALAVGAGFVGPALLWFAARALAYRAWLPLPFYLKVARSSGLGGVGAVADFAREAVLPLAPLLALALGFAAVRRGPMGRALAVLAPTSGLLLFFLVPEHVMGVYHRFLVPWLPGLCALAAAGLAAVWGATRLRLAVRVAAVALVLAGVSAWLARPADAVRSSAVGYAEGLRQAHAALAADLGDKRALGCRLSLGDAGLVPYRTGWPTLDSFGLNDRHIALTGDHSPEYVLAWAPDVLVVLSSRAEAFSPLLPWEAALRDAALARGYQHARTYRFNDGYFLWVLERAVRPECVLPRAAAAGG